MKKNIEELKGLWRGKAEYSDVEFIIRTFDDELMKGRSFFNVYSEKENKIIFQWQAKPSLIQVEGGDFEMHLEELLSTEEENKYLNLKIRHLSEEEMTIQDGEMGEFKLNRIK